MALTLELTTKQFLKLYGQKKYVKPFSKKSVELILKYIGEDQEAFGITSITWKRVFEKSRELDNADFVLEGIDPMDKKTNYIDLENGKFLFIYKP